MTALSLQRLDAWLRALVPLATALLAVLADVLPLFHVGPASVTPLATLCVAFFWSLYRPDLFGGGTFWENVDCSQTRAYAMGLGQIYFNMRGRESRGIVSPGAEAKQLADELSARLLTMTDPDDGSRIVRAVYKRDDVYAGPYLSNASELQVGMEDGYRVSWQTTLGGSPQGIVYPNMKKWSGDHGGYDFATTAGVLISNRPLTGTSASIIDIAPTVLKFYGVPIPSEIDGKPLF